MLLQPQFMYKIWNLWISNSACSSSIVLLQPQLMYKIWNLGISYSARGSSIALLQPQLMYKKYETFAFITVRVVG